MRLGERGYGPPGRRNSVHFAAIVSPSPLEASRWAPAPASDKSSEKQLGVVFRSIADMAITETAANEQPQKHRIVLSFE